MAYKAKRGGVTSIFVPFATGTGGVKRDTLTNLRAVAQTFTPILPGTYTPFLVATIANKPVTYRGVPIRVVTHA